MGVRGTQAQRSVVYGTEITVILISSALVRSTIQSQLFAASLKAKDSNLRGTTFLFREGTVRLLLGTFGKGCEVFFQPSPSFLLP